MYHPRYAYLCYLVLLLASLRAPGALAQSRQLQHWSVGEGLPQSQVYALHVDRWGYVWAGTQGGGIGRFDGETFTIYAEANGLAGNYIQAFAEDKQGRIWAGTESGVSYFDGRRWTTLPDFSHAVTALLARPPDSLWIGTTQGLFLLHAGAIQPTHLDQQTVRALTFVESVTYASTDKGLYRRFDKEWQTQPLTTGRPTEVWDALALDGTIYVASLDQGLLQVAGDRLVPVADAAAPRRQATCLFRESGGRLWIGTQHQGIVQYNPTDSSWSRLDERDGLGTDYVRRIARDDWGHIWIGTSGAGLASYRGQPFIAFRPRIDLPGRAVYAVDGDSLQRVTVSVDDLGVFTHDDGRFVPLLPDTFAVDVKIKSLLRDRFGYWWAGTEGKGLLRQTRKGWQWMDANDGLGGNFIRALAHGDAASIWVGLAGGGLTQVSYTDSTQTITQRITTREGLRSNAINDVLVDKQNRLWVAYRNRGISYLRAGEVVGHYDRRSGLPANGVRSLTEDAAGYLWVGTSGEGIARLPLYEAGDWQRFGRAEGLTSENIYSILPVGNTLWVGSERGVDEIRLNADRQVIQVAPHGRQDGFTGVETCTNAVWLDSLSNAWFGTVNGLMLRVAGPQEGAIGPPPRLRLADVRLFYRSLRETPYDSILTSWGEVLHPLRLNYRANHLGFTLSAVAQNQPQDIRYRWRLVDWDADWSPWTQQREITYANLPAGAYRFEAQAAVDPDRPSRPLQLSVLIEPPVWQRSWFRWAVGIGSGALLLSFIGFIGYRSRQRARAREARLQLEKRAIELEQRALQLQMNPHFIFNALNGVQNLIGRADHQTASEQLTRFSRLMRGVLQSSRQETISLADEIANLTDYLALENFSYGEKFTYRIRIEPDDLDTEEIAIPPMILQPLVENAIHHGLRQKEEPGQIDLLFEYVGDDRLRCTISDNGVGLTVARANHSPHHQSTALAVARERLQHLLPDLAPATLLQLNTRYDAQGQTIGAEVVVWLPVSIVV